MADDEPTATAPLPALPTELISIARLRAHPRNYRRHPEYQLAHIVHSVRKHGIYKNVVVAEDDTLLAGHGVLEAAEAVGYTEIEVKRLPYPPGSPEAISVLTGDNEIPLSADDDDRLLAELLKEVKDFSIDGLLGTGYTDEMLAALAYVTRPASELTSIDAAREWVGLPAYSENADDVVTDDSPKVVVSFANEGDRQAFMAAIGVSVIHKKTRGTWSIRWPERAKEDLASLRFVEGAAAPSE